MYPAKCGRQRVSAGTQLEGCDLSFVRGTYFGRRRESVLPFILAKAKVSSKGAQNTLDKADRKGSPIPLFQIMQRRVT